MKFSENWLREQIVVDANRDALCATLTAIGLEVEDVVPLGDGLDGVVVARIVSAAPHPQADRLQVCEVDAGAHGTLQIVCGAPNARAGLVAPLATVGARIGETTITAATLRGVASNGMLCSAKELGLDGDASGLLVLPDDAPVGAPLAGYLGLPDASIDIKLTPNRADCFGIRGIAFDVAAACGGSVAALDASPVAAVHEGVLQVMLDAGADAPRYVGRVVDDVDAGAATPVWMAERLRRSGVRPVSLLVDITQYVMLATGQPMHAFDRDLLCGPVGVRRARAGESLMLLDGRDVALDDGYLVVTDDDRPVALAGVMGGQDTRVGATTRRVFLEAAHFAPAAIIGRGRRLGLHTDAGHRFERGVDPALPRVAIEMATRLLVDLAGGKPGPVVEAEVADGVPVPRSIGLRRDRLARLLGLAVPDADVARILRALGLDVEETADGWRVGVPTRRFDLAIEEDLIEEVARIHGYDAIPATLPDGAVAVAADAEACVPEGDLRRHMAARDYLEAINYAFVDGARLAHWQHDADAVALANPLSGDLGTMRTLLLPGLVDALARNVARQQAQVRLFEIGKVFTAAADDAGGPRETPRLAAVAMGAAAREQWGAPARGLDFHDLRGDLDSLATVSGVRLALRASTRPWGHPGRSADVLCGDDGAQATVGWIGELHPRLCRALGVDATVLAFEVDLAALQARALPRAGAVSRYPSVRRDLAFVVGDTVPWAAIEDAVRQAAGPALREVRLFDVYVGKGVETGCKSVAMGLILQEDSRTLTDRDVDDAVARIVEALRAAHGAEIRS